MHASGVGVGRGVGMSATHIRHQRVLLYQWNTCAIMSSEGVNEIRRALDGAPVCITVTSLET